MSKIKINDNLFLGKQELDRLYSFLYDGIGSPKNIFNSLIYSSGIFKSLNKDSQFKNYKVISGTNPGTIRLEQDSYAIDNNGNIIYKKAEDNIKIPNDGKWYWVKIKHKYSPLEVGTISVDISGNITGLNTRFLEVLRGTNQPVKVRFEGTLNNFESYEVLEVINNTNAKLSGAFVAESNLKLIIVGSFTDGFVVPEAYKDIYQYDSCIDFTINSGIVIESSINEPPTKSTGLDFFIARVRCTNNNIVIQDKRVEIVKLSADNEVSFVEKGDNPLMGVESIQWQTASTPKFKNLITIGWGFRTKNWTIESSLRRLTLSSGQGGKYKSTADFEDGDFDNWRVQTSLGKKYKILQSFKQGNQINLTLDSLDIIDFVENEEVVIIPDVEEVGFRIESLDYPILNKDYYFAARECKAVLEVENPTLSENTEITIYYTYKTLNEYSDFNLIPNDGLYGYYNENSFEDNGELKLIPTREVYFDGIFSLKPDPNNFIFLLSRIDLGDKIGVTLLENLTNQIYNLVVGTDKNYIYLYNANTLEITDNIKFNLPLNAREGNNFVIHIEIPQGVIFREGASLQIVEGYNTDNQRLLKDIKIGDFWEGQNREGGIRFDLKFTGKNWFISQNYDLGTPLELSQLDLSASEITNFFDGSTGLGKVKGLFGKALCNSARTQFGVTIPDLRKRFLVNNDNSNSEYTPKATGGEEKVTLAVGQLPRHSFKLFANGISAPSSGSDLTPDSPVAKETSSSGTRDEKYAMRANNTTPTLGVSSTVGNNEEHENRPPYYAVVYIKKLY